MAKNLEEAIRNAGSPVKLLWESKTPPAVVPRVVPEFTNWRDEQMAWRRTAVLFDQSHHMANLNIKGPDALKLISSLAVNSVAKFPVDMAKQFVAVNHDGYVIGDNILFHLEEDEYQAVGIPPSINWLHFHAATGGYDVARLARRQLLLPQGRSGALPLPGAGSRRDGCDPRSHGPGAAEAEVLPHDALQDRGQRRARAAPRHGGRAGLRDVGPVGGQRRRARRAARGRQEARHGAGRRPRLPHERAGVRLAAAPATRRSTPARS